MIRDDLKARVIAWAEARNFFGEGGATVEGQLAKLLEEASELVTDIVRGRDATDSVGDCLVVLIILERMGYRVRWGAWPSRRRAVESAATFAGDVALCFTSVSGISSCDLMDAATLLNIDPNTALEHALREIEPRRGSWSGGVFVKEASAEKPAQGDACKHGTVPAGMTCEVCYSEWNSGRRGPPHPPLATPIAAPAPGVPEGWKLVPVQATKEMTKAVRYDEDALGVKSAWPSDIWRAMLAAAPEVPRG